MPKVKGIYISLEECHERRTRLETHLSELNIRKNYSYYKAIKGEECEGKIRGLKKGEIGIWKSWIDILRNEVRDTTKVYEYLHVIEDDAILSNELLAFLEKLPTENVGFDILYTDMYVNPIVYKQLSPEHKELRAKKHIKVIKGVYTGCMSSCLIHRSRIDKILNELEKYINNEKFLIPIDNYIRRLMLAQVLKICYTAPFLTCVDKRSIANSTIQVREYSKNSVTLSQEFCYYLRKNLGINEIEEEEILESCKLLLDITKNLVECVDDKIDQTTEIIDYLVTYCLEKKVLRYKLEPRLKNEPMNEQSE